MIDLIRRGQSSIYGQVSATLKGLTATNLVQNGNFDGTTKWSGSNATVSAVNNVLSVTGDGTASNPRTYQVISSLANKTDKVFAKAYVRVTNAVCTSIKIYWNSAPSGEVVISNPVENMWYLINTSVVSPVFGASPAIFVSHSYTDVDTANGKVMEIKEATAINMTAEGLEDLTADQMNAKFPHWFDGTKSTNSVRVKSVGKNLFDGKIYGTLVNDWSLDGRDVYKLTHGTGLFWDFNGKPNTQYTISLDYKRDSSSSGTTYIRAIYSDGTRSNIVDTINKSWTHAVKTTDVGKTLVGIGQLIGSVGVSYIDKNTIQIEEGTTATEYEPYKESSVIINLPEPLRSVPSANDEVNVSTGIKTQNVKPYVLQAADIVPVDVGQVAGYDRIQIARPANMSAAYRSTGVGIGVLYDKTTGLPIAEKTTTDAPTQSPMVSFRDYHSFIGYYVTTGTYTLATAKTALEGTTLTYQLAEPVVTQLDPQPLTIFPNGTQYIEFGTKEVAEYADGINISNAEIPIKAMKTVDKLHIEDGHWKRTAIDLANVAVSPDGLSFTIADAVNGETYEYSYDYDSALSTMPELVIPAEPSLVVIKNQNISL